MATFNYNVRIGSGTPGTVRDRHQGRGGAHPPLTHFARAYPIALAGVSYHPHDHWGNHGADQLSGRIAAARQRQSRDPVSFGYGKTLFAEGSQSFVLC